MILYLYYRYSVACYPGADVDVCYMDITCEQGWDSSKEYIMANIWELYKNDWTTIMALKTKCSQEAKDGCVCKPGYTNLISDGCYKTPPNCPESPCQCQDTGNFDMAVSLGFLL